MSGKRYAQYRTSRFGNRHHNFISAYGVIFPQIVLHLYICHREASPTSLHSISTLVEIVQRTACKKHFTFRSVLRVSMKQSPWRRRSWSGHVWALPPLLEPQEVSSVLCKSRHLE